MKKIFNLDNLFCTLFIIAIILLFADFLSRLNFLNPIEAALSDFDETDIVFSLLREEHTADTNIILVNIGDLPRQGIAEQIKIINQYKPKIIGIDAFFRSDKGLEIDTPLQNALSEVKNLVLVSKVWNYNKNTNIWDTLETSHPKFNDFASTGFANLLTEGEDEFRTSRSFSPKENVKDKIEKHFTVKIAEIYNPKTAEKLLSRNNKVEIINYRGNFEKYYTFDVTDIFNPDVNKNIIKDKIVLMGYMGATLSLHPWEELQDKFFTPLNKKYAGKTYADMFGIVVHANIISMILHDNFINKINEIVSYLISGILCFFTVVFFSYIYENHRKWYDGTTFLIAIIEAFLISYCILHIFNYFSIKITLTLGIVAILLTSNLLEFYYSVVKNTAIIVKKFLLKKIVRK